MGHHTRGGTGQTPEQFVEKWSRLELTERAASHEHSIDLHLKGCT
jgi:hypothetical protein